MEGINEEQKQNARKRIVNLIIRLFGVNGSIDSNGILSFIHSIITNEDAGLRPPEQVTNFILDNVQPVIEREAGGLPQGPDGLIRLFDTINDLIKQGCDFDFSDLIERFTQNYQNNFHTQCVIQCHGRGQEPNLNLGVNSLAS